MTSKASTAELSRLDWWPMALAVALALGLIISPVRAVDTTWILNGDGVWTNSAAWDNGQPTNTSFNVFIDDGDSSVTVTLDVSRSIGGLNIGGDDTLLIDDGFALTIAGDVDNDGLISLESAGANTDLLVSGTRNLTGNGVLRLGGTSQDRVRGGGVLVNGPQHTIEGAGNLGTEETDFINQAGGTVDANVMGSVLLAMPETNFDNQGTMQATGGGILQLTGAGTGNFRNASGTILANGIGSRVELVSNPNVTDGTLRTLAGGRIQVNGGTSARVSNVTIDGQLMATNNSTLRLGGIVNIQAGSTILIDADTDNATLSLNGALTLQGGGTVRLAQTGAGGTAILRSAPVLTNVDNTIEGEGSLGFEETDFVNQAGGTISANVVGGVLLVDPETNFENQGIMEATGGGILRLTGASTSNFLNANGTIRATGGGSRVDLTAGANVSGGTLQTSSGGQIQVNDANTVTVSNVTLDGELVVRNNSRMRFGGDIINNGLISLQSTGGNSDLEIIGGTHNLTGTGVLRLGGTLQDRVRGGGVLVNGPMHTIEGAGNLGTEETDFINQAGGIVDANVSGGVLLVDPENNFDNEGTLRATGGGILRLTGNAASNFRNAGGTILSNGAGSRVELVSNPNLTDGTLRTTAGGVFQVNEGNSARVANVTVDGELTIADAATLLTSGTITNQAGSVIKVAADTSTTALRLNAATTLEGGGTLRLMQTGNGGSAILASGGTLTNVDNTIEGEGNLGFEETEIVNLVGGIIDANIPGGVLVVDPETNFTNQGIMRATGGGVLRLTGNATSNILNAGGTIRADGALSRVDLVSNVWVTEGTLQTSSGGLILVDGGGTSARVNNVTLAGELAVAPSATMVISGTITNQSGSTISINADVANAALRISGNTTLQGGGIVRLSQTAGGGTAIVASGGVLTNIDNTIEGVGNLGLEETDFVNEVAGTVHANVPGGVLLVDPETNFVNRGTMLATGGGILRLTGNSTSNFLNDGGILRVVSDVELVSGGVFRNNLGGLVEGTGVFRTAGGSFTNVAGVVAPGLSVGVLTIDGDYTQNTEGTTEIELAGLMPGTEYDQLVVTGTATLAGFLDVSLLAPIVDPTTPGQQDAFTVMTVGAFSGSFDTVVYDGDVLVPTFGPDADGSFQAYLGQNQNMDDGLFRTVKYTDTELILTNYLALPGDANGDGNVDVSDFNIWNANKFTTGTNWATGDFDNSGFTDVSDFNIWNANKFTSAGGPMNLVPEPSAMLMLVIAGMCWLWKELSGG